MSQWVSNSFIYGDDAFDNKYYSLNYFMIASSAAMLLHRYSNYDKNCVFLINKFDFILDF